MTAIVAAAAIAMCGQAVAQDCNACGGGYVEAPHVHQHQGNTTCGRSINNHDAAALWTNYCNEDCSQNTCGGGCGLGHGGGCGLGGGCSLGGKLSGMFGGLRNRSCGGDSVCGGESVCGGLSFLQSWEPNGRRTLERHVWKHRLSKQSRRWMWMRCCTCSCRFSM